MFLPAILQRVLFCEKGAKHGGRESRPLKAVLIAASGDIFILVEYTRIYTVQRSCLPSRRCCN